MTWNLLPEKTCKIEAAKKRPSRTEVTWLNASWMSDNTPTFLQILHKSGLESLPLAVLFKHCIWPSNVCVRRSTFQRPHLVPCQSLGGGGAWRGRGGTLYNTWRGVLYTTFQSDNITTTYDCGAKETKTILVIELASVEHDWSLLTFKKFSPYFSLFCASQGDAKKHRHGRKEKHNIYLRVWCGV